MAEEVSRSFGIFRGRAHRVNVGLKDNAPPVYVYEDESLRLEIPVPPLEVFLAFVRELDKLGAEGVDAEKYVATLARAFWLLHQRPRKRGLFRKRVTVPEPRADEAEAFLVGVFPRLDLVLESLSRALSGLVTYVLGKGEGTTNG